MKMLISSPKHGSHFVYFDDEDIDLIKQYKWGLWKSKSGKLYAFHSWKRNGEEVSIKMHRLVMGLERLKTPLLDHCDGNSLNNKKINLRIAQPSQNSMNRGKTIKNKSGYKGVTKTGKSRYTTMITVNGVTHKGGSFKSVIDAARKYDEMAIKHHGEFAFLNFQLDKKVTDFSSDTIYIQQDFPRKRLNSTGYRGVCTVDGAKLNKFRAYINVNKVRVELGCFPDALTAAKEYDNAAKKYHSNLATLNFPND